jgi:hypothetical protein
MQEEIVSKSVDIAVRITALTAKEILNALEKIVATMEKKQAERSPTAQKSPQASKQP